MPTDGLRRSLGLSQYFSFSFGVIVGVGWIVLLGQWLQAGGPLGAILGFALGGAMMAVIGLCYAETATMFPRSGGEMVYAFAGFGSRAGYIVGWALTLAYISAVSYVCLSMAWILDVLVPGIRGPALYFFRGEPIHLGSLVVAIGTCAGFTLLNYRGVRSSGRFQDLFTYTKILVAVVFLAAGIIGGHTENLRPLFQTANGGTPIGSVLAVLAIVPWFFGGFNTLPQIMEERSPETPLRMIGPVTVFAILAAAAFYCLAILSASMALPWQVLVTRELPAAAAFRESFGSELLARMVLLTGLFGVATVGNGTFISATRILFAMSRGHLLGPGFAQTNPRTGAPDRAVLLVGMVALVGVFLGRNGIGPIVGLGATCLALGYFVTSAAMLRLRVTAPELPRPYRAPLGIPTGLAASLGAAGLLAAALFQPLAGAKGSVPIEWLFLGAWTVIGMAIWLATRATRTTMTDSERREAILGTAES